MCDILIYILGPNYGGGKEDNLETETSYPTSKVRGGSQEELPHVQGVAAAPAQEG